MTRSSGCYGNKGNSAAPDRALFDEAVALARSENRLSVSIIQQRLFTSYSRAAKLFEQLQAEGVISC